jgi:hypothetical protein
MLDTLHRLTLYKDKQHFNSNLSIRSAHDNDNDNGNDKPIKSLHIIDSARQVSCFYLMKEAEFVL